MSDERDEPMRRAMDLINRRAREYDNTMILPLNNNHARPYAKQVEEAMKVRGVVSGDGAGCAPVNPLIIDSRAMRAAEAAEAAKPPAILCDKPRARRRRVKRSR